MIARRHISVAAVLALLFVCRTGLALEPPDGPVVLTISGKIANMNAGQTAAFSMRMIEALPQQTFTIKTPWYPKPMQFTGPLLRDLLGAAGSSGSKVITAGLDDYKTEIPVADTVQYNMLVARLLNGKPMSVREKGPLFLLYPFDSKPELQTERYYNRSTWQLVRLTVQ